MTDRYESRATTHAAVCWSWGPKHYECAVREIEILRAEVEKLRADLAESDELHEKLRQLLTRTAAALKGEPPEGVWHSWHDLPERADHLREQLRGALAHPAITHCDNCGCDWLDNGLNPVGCPYCKQSEYEYTIAALRERLGEKEQR